MYIKQPIPDVLLDLIKLNPRYSQAKPTDFEAMKPTLTPEGETEVWVRGVKASGVVGSVKLKYRRTNIAVMFHGMVPTLPEATKHDAVECINVFYGTKLPKDEFDVIVVDEYKISLQAKSGSYTHVGTIDVNLTPSDVSVIGTKDEVVDRRRSAEDYTRSLSFLTLGSLSEVEMGDLSTKQAKIVASALIMETMDPWKSTMTPNPYNLYGASVTHNGPHQYDNIRGNLLLKVELNPSHSKNLVGELHLFYSIPTEE